jgi:hypothetical protein
MAKKKSLQIVPPRGPASNLRPAGAHQDKRRKKLARLGDKERELDELKAIGACAFDEDE